jgi:hypothetical protein
MKLRVVVVAVLAILAVACGSAEETIASGDGDAPDTTTTVAPATSTTVEGPLGAGPYPIANLDIEISPDGGKAYSYFISCLGDTATIGEGESLGTVTPEAACLALNEQIVADRLFEVGVGDRVCTEIYGSADTAAIVGSLDGTDVSTQVNRNDGCGINDWDVVLAALLPPPAS